MRRAGMRAANRGPSAGLRRRRRTRWWVALTAGLVGCASVFGSDTGELSNGAIPGRQLIGERLDFRVRWGLVTAGAATFEVEKVGRERLRFRLSARTSPFVDAFYRVRDRMESIAVLPDLDSAKYEKFSEEKRRTKHEEVRFQRTARTAVFSRDGEKRSPIAVGSLVHDPLAALYAYRLRGPGSGSRELEVSDGKKTVRGEIELLGREVIETPAGTFETLKVEPRLEGVGGVFRRSPGARVFIWLTDDEWRRPVKLESEVAVGSFTAELVAGEHGDWAVSAAAAE